MAQHRAETTGVDDGRRPLDPDSFVDRWLMPLALFGLAWAVYAWLSNGRHANLDYFVPLADAFLHGRLGLTNAPSWLNEVVPGTNGLSWVVYPPSPAIVLLPAVALFGPDIDQTWASVLLGAANVAVLSLVIRGMGVARWPRLVLSIVFGFGSIVWYSAQAGSSWHFAHVVTTAFLLLAILAAQRDWSTWLIGFLFAAAVLARLSAAGAFPFFLAYLVDRADREATGDRTAFGRLGAERATAWAGRIRARATLALAVPAAIAGAAPLALDLVYNRLRFGSLFENGYSLIPGIQDEAQYAHGVFNLVNIPRMLYAMFLTTPQQVGDFPWVQSYHLGGLSILLTTPLFLWAIKARRPDRFGVGAWLSVVLTLLPILLHFDPGGAQFGFRYAQDLYPILFLLTIRGLSGRISFEAWVAIAVGGLVNLWGMGSTYYDWWH
jgi:hypothetical protein